MHRGAKGTWRENRLPSTRRPTALPNKWGAHWIAEDIIERWQAKSFEEEEQLYAFAITAYQYMLAVGPPWTCFSTDAYTPWPRYEGELPVGTEPNWRAFDVLTYTDFLAHYEGGWPPDRVANILRHTDLFADYMVAAGIIDEQLRTRWVTEAQVLVDDLSMLLNRRGRRARRKLEKRARRGKGPARQARRG